MIIIGASGHAVEILDVLTGQIETGALAFYHPVASPVLIESLKNFSIIREESILLKHLRNDPRFILGIGDSQLRFKMAAFCISNGGKMESAISGRSYISSLNVRLGSGLNIMHQVTIHPEVIIEDGVLINAGTIIHHESYVGKYSQVCPSVTLTGKVTIGEFSMIGAGSIILPKIKIGNNVIVAAGSVVKNDVPDNVMVAGVPAVIKKKLPG